MSGIGATFWSFAGMGPYVAAVPYTSNAAATGPYLWANENASNQFARPSGSPGCRIGAVVGQFLMLADLYQQQTTALWTSDGSSLSVSGTIQTPAQSTGSIFDQAGQLAGSWTNGIITGSGKLTGGTVDTVTGTVTLTFSSAPTTGDVVYAQYIQAAPYRVAWSAIGNPTNWPVPLSNQAIAAQSGINDLDPQAGPCMAIAGYPQYGIVLQRRGITRASYIGGNVVWSWQPYEFKRGLMAHGAFVKVDQVVYFLADDGLWMTDGANVSPLGTAGDNSAGLDRWLYGQLNTSALESIRMAYDSTKRNLFLAIPTGSNTLPDTLLTYNVLAQRWTRSAIPVESLWTVSNGGPSATRQTVGIMSQAHVPQALTGPPLTGYLESADLYDASGNLRITTGALPHVESTDQPLVTIGNRDSLQDPVSYPDSEYPDTFTRIAPVTGEGRYTRARVSSTSATNLQGVTLMTEARDGI